jgi:hypothetical protein
MGVQVSAIKPARCGEGICHVPNLLDINGHNDEPN